MYGLLLAGAFQFLNGLLLNIPKWIALGRQSGEFTPEQEAEWQANYKVALAQPHWKPDAK
jgi:hypothetical protein